MTLEHVALDIYLVTIWILVASSVLLAISNYLLWADLEKMKHQLNTELSQITFKLINISELIGRICAVLGREKTCHGKVIPMRRPGKDDPRSAN